MRQDTRWETTLRLGSDAYLPKKRFVQRQYSISIYCLQFHCICSQKQKVLECFFLSCWPYYQPRILLAMSGPSINKAVFSKIVSHHNIKCAINQVTQNVLFRPQNGFLFNCYSPPFSVFHEKFSHEKHFDIAKQKNENAFARKKRRILPKPEGYLCLLQFLNSAGVSIVSLVRNLICEYNELSKLKLGGYT